MSPDNAIDLTQRLKVADHFFVAMPDASSRTAFDTEPPPDEFIMFDGGLLIRKLPVTGI